MPKYRITLPDGTVHEEEGVTQRDAWNSLQTKLGKSVLPGREGQPALPHETGGVKRGPGQIAINILKGILQGGLDPVEGAIQLGEHIAGSKIPLDTWRKTLRDFRKDVRSTPEGRIGEFGGNVAVLGVPGMAAMRGAAMAGLGARTLSGAVGGATSGMMQPVQGARNDADYWATKGGQAALGTLAGGASPWLGGVVSQWARDFRHLPWWARHSLGLTVAPYAARPVGRFMERAPGVAKGLPAAAVEPGSGEAKAEEAPKRQPLRLTVHPDSPEADEQE